MTIKDYLLQEEEGRVGSIDGLIVSVYTEPLLNPSFHIRTKTFDRHCAYQIKDFKLLEQKTKDGFNNKELKKISAWFDQNNEHFSHYTNWEVLVREWNITNENNRIPISTEKPVLE